MDEIPPRAPSPPPDAVRHTYPPPPRRPAPPSSPPLPLPIRGRWPERLLERSNEELEELLFDFESDDDNGQKEVYKLLPPVRDDSYGDIHHHRDRHPRHQHHQDDRDDGDDVRSSYRQPTVVTVSSEGSDNEGDEFGDIGGVREMQEVDDGKMRGNFVREISGLNIMEPGRRRRSRDDRVGRSRFSRDGGSGFGGDDDEEGCGF